MKIWAHTLIKNEEKFIWFSVMSVINYVDKMLIWDNGSTDKTPEIIKELFKKAKNKIIYKRVNTSFINENIIRQQMLEATHADWLLMLDGDEIWWDDSIKKIIQSIYERGNNIESIVVPTVNLVGDFYHHLEDKAGRFNLAGRSGHLNLRALNLTIPGLHSLGREWDWGWADGDNLMIQNRDSDKIAYLEAPYLHCTHLIRSSNLTSNKNAYRRVFKTKYEIGIPFSLDYYYPEVFFRPRLDIISLPWSTMSNSYRLRAFIETPLKKIKRRFV